MTDQIITIINWPPPNASNLVSRIPPHISICRTGGYHAYMAGPCFDTLEQAIEHKDMYDRLGPAEMHRRRL